MATGCGPGVALAGSEGGRLDPGWCARVLGRSGGMSMNFGDSRSGFPVLRFLAMLKAARDLGLDPEAVNAAALRFDPREPDLDGVADELAAALLRRNTLAIPDAV